MLKTDLIVCWPDNCDYPLFRLFIHETGRIFGRVIVVFTKANREPSYKEWVKDDLKHDALCIDSPPLNNGIEDWRDVAVKAALAYSDAAWVWFTEQDFEMRAGFLAACAKAQSDNFEVAAVYQGDRMHPCSILIKRSLLNHLMQVEKVDFGIIPNEADHFIKLQRAIERAQIPVFKMDPDTYYHYNGLSHNWSLLANDETITYHPDEFKAYLKECLEAPVTLDARFVKTVLKALDDPSVKPEQNAVNIL